MEINENKMKVILSTSPPSNKNKLQGFLGKINFLRRFILNICGKTKNILISDASKEVSVGVSPRG